MKEIKIISSIPSDDADVRRMAANNKIHKVLITEQGIDREGNHVDVIRDLRTGERYPLPYSLDDVIVPDLTPVQSANLKLIEDTLYNAGVLDIFVPDLALSMLEALDSTPDNQGVQATIPAYMRL